MQIQTSRFGSIELENEDLIEFPEGIPGFASLRKFVLLDDPSDDIFAWLQSCENPAVAFPILEPELFADNYKITLTRRDLESLHLQAGEPYHTFCIITIPNDPRKMTANLKAPIIINARQRIGRQCVLQDNALAINEPIFAILQSRVVQTPSQPIKSRVVETGMGVRVVKKTNSEVQA